MVKVLHNKKAFDRDMELQFQKNDKLISTVGNQPLNDFIEVATINTDDLNKAYQLTNSIDDNWFINPNIKVAYDINEQTDEDTEMTRKRSTSISDIMDLNGQFYVVADIGFEKLKGVNMKQITVVSLQHTNQLDKLLIPDPLKTTFKSLASVAKHIPVGQEAIVKIVDKKEEIAFLDGFRYITPNKDGTYSYTQLLPDY